MAGAPQSNPGRPFGNYEILGLIGRGGMAEVYRARVLSGPREGWSVAIKRLLPDLAKDPSYVDLFTSEADLSRLLDHPNIVKVLEVGLLQDIYFMVMELVDGRDLAQIIRRCKQRAIPLPIDFALFLARTLADALEYAHTAKSPTGRALKVVHCDVSPSNLFISRTGEIKLGDFGVARARVGSAGELGLIGKPYYVSPQVLADEVSPAADVWSTVVTLYELLTLERPFQGKTPDEVFDRIQRLEFPPVQSLRQDVPPPVIEVITRGLARNPKDRFQSAAELSAALAVLYDELIGTPLAIAAVVRGLFGAEG